MKHFAQDLTYLQTLSLGTCPKVWSMIESMNNDCVSDVIGVLEDRV